MSIWTRIAENIAAVGNSVGGFLTKLARSRATVPEKSIGFTIGMRKEGRTQVLRGKS
jgi:hypothetical protein